MALTFKKSEKSKAQFVYDGETRLGAVRKDEAWTVRGNRVTWSAYRKGAFIGSAETRAEAANLLVTK